ncbi:MAG: transglutaminase-like domain-containing protein [Kibdelosporangium sp.]
MTSDDTRELFLSPARYIDSDHPVIRRTAAKVAPGAAPAGKARALYYEVRDSIAYSTLPPSRAGSMADYLRDPETYRASSVLAAGSGYCVSKAALYTALCRAAGIPAKIAFADVRNHHVTGWRLREALGTNLFAWHGYSEILLDGRWITVTLMFDTALCDRLGVAPIEFDGESDALLQPFDSQGRRFFGYVSRHGTFHDVPAEFLSTEMPSRYPGLHNHRSRSGRSQPASPAA